MQRRGVRFTVISTIASQSPMVADELRRQADEFIDIVELQPFIVRDPAARPARRDQRQYSPRAAQRESSPS